ncbi:hypothetical protein BU17DRAFT_36454, partial [Hysterangium stoloniferum]
HQAALLFFDFFQGVGKVFSVKWLDDGLVQCGGYCTAQGMVQQIGETGVAQSTLAIAVHTFIIIFFREGAKAVRTSVIVVISIGFFALVFPAIGAGVFRDGDSRYILPIPYWCWVSRKHIWAQVAGEYIWMWLSAFVSLAVYIPLYLQLAGYINPTWTGNHWWQFRIERSKKQGILASSGPDILTELHCHDRYPISYFFLVLPDSVVRWITFLDAANSPSSATFFATSVFGLSGLVNVALLYFGRPGKEILKLFSFFPKQVDHVIYRIVIT